MQDRELYRRVLGIESPCYVKRVDLKRVEGEVHVFLEHQEVRSWASPACGAALIAASLLYSGGAKARVPVLRSDQSSIHPCSNSRQTLQLHDAFSSGPESQQAEAHYARGLKFQAQRKDADAENEFRAAWAGRPEE